MTIAIATLADGRTVEYHDEILGVGGEKEVYFTKDRTEVVCFYKNPDAGRRLRIDEIVGKNYNPTQTGNAHAEYWKSVFCWPTAVVVAPRLGVLAPAYPKSFYFPKDPPNDFFAGGEKNGKWFLRGKYARSLVQKLAPTQLGDLRSMMAITIKLARGVRRMHAAGLAHSDLSFNNVLIDPTTGGAIIIDIDSLVVRGLYPPMVMGTPGFIAPEVVATQHLPVEHANRAHPSMHTDRFALAALIYQYLLLRDPINGPKHHDADPAIDEMSMRGPKALFIEHPTDQSNRPSGLAPTIKDLGPELEALFLKAFVDGLHTVAQRPTASDWEQALMRSFNLLIQCNGAQCEMKWFPCWSKSRAVCPFCGTAQQVPVPVLQLMKPTTRPGNWSPDYEFACSRGRQLLAQHVFTKARIGEEMKDEDRTPLASVEYVNGTGWVLTNHALTGLLSSKGTRVLPGQSAALAAGARLQLTSEPNGRLAEVVMVTP